VWRFAHVGNRAFFLSLIWRRKKKKCSEAEVLIFFISNKIKHIMGFQIAKINANWT